MGWRFSLAVCPWRFSLVVCPCRFSLVVCPWRFSLVVCQPLTCLLPGIAVERRKLPQQTGRIHRSPARPRFGARCRGLLG